MTRKDAVLRRERCLFGNACDETEVHGKVAVRDLSDPDTAVFVLIKDMRMQQNGPEYDDRHRNEQQRNNPAEPVRIACAVRFADHNDHDRGKQYHNRCNACKQLRGR